MDMGVVDGGRGKGGALWHDLTPDIRRVIGPYTPALNKINLVDFPEPCADLTAWVSLAQRSWTARFGLVLGRL